MPSDQKPCALLMAASKTAADILAVYTGARTSARILAGEAQRGKGGSISAAVLLADLRNFTALTDVYEPGEIAGFLDAHFELIGRHDEFDSFVVELGAVSDTAGFVEKLKGIIAEHDVLRLKGFIDVSGKPMRLQLQAVGARIDQYFDRAWAPGEARNTRLVVIGLHEMDQDAVRKAIEALVRG